ncbi:MAG: YitT family protein [Ruminococcaceae bacterium]|nr:YitT family protein [Oscillospiraceae bacterium]
MQFEKVKDYTLIVIGGLLYAVSTNFFIFPHALLLGGTSGISVILEAFLPFSPGVILMVINFALLILAFAVLGRGMAVRTLVGSVVTTLFIGLMDIAFPVSSPVVSDVFISSVVGAAIIALASGVMFYVDSSSGGTDIIALIVRKFSRMDIGKALLVTDIAIVVAGGMLSGWSIAICSFVGLLIKTLGIDAVIGIIKHKKDGDYKNV